MAKNTANLKLLKTSNRSGFFFIEKNEQVPSNIFDPIARKQHELKVAMLLVNCLNSYIRTPLFPGKLIVGGHHERNQ